MNEDVRLAEVSAPVHLVAGWYDFFLRGQLKDYEALKAAGRHPYLTVGPWYHLQPTNPMGMIDGFREGILWLEAHLKGERSGLRQLPVRIYVLGAGWRDLPDFPPPSTERRYYLRGDGSLAESPEDGTCDPKRYTYDPNDPTPIRGGAAFDFRGGARDCRPLERRRDVLCYTAAVFRQAVTMIGYLRLELYVESSNPYTDFHGRVCDVHPNGRVVNICEGLFRLTPDNVQRGEDGVARITIDLWATAYRFAAGHALRLHVSSGAHPHWARNPGTGELFGVALRSSEQCIYHDADHPSALVVPITEH